MGIFDASFEQELASILGKFKTIDEFESKVIEFANELKNILEDKNHRHHKAIKDWRVKLFNEEHHSLYPHQQEAVAACILDIVLSDEKQSGYCFMPTSGGKSYIIFTLAALGITDFRMFNLVEASMPNYFREKPQLIPVWVSINLEYAQMLAKEKTTKTQILVHDIAILDQLRDEAKHMLGKLADLVQFTSVQSHGNETRRDNLRYVIIDECHWGNATQEETIQSELVGYVKQADGRAFGFTASPYEHPDGKFQRTWSQNKIMGDRDFNYYLDHDIIYPIKLKEVNLQNARIDYELGDEEIDLVEKSQVVEFIAKNILTTVPQRGLDGPAICFFSPVIIPDIVQELIDNDRDNQVKPHIKVLGSPESTFIKKCEHRFGKEILATNDTIKKLKDGEKIFLISQQKLLVGLNAPLLRYCFISPTASKIKILQGIGRLMRPSKVVNEKLAVLYLASLAGNKMDIGEEKEKDSTEREPCATCGKKVCDCPCEACGQPRNTECECPKARYVSTSMTLSEAYDLPHKVFYKEVVGFRDFINETRINDANTVYKIPTRHLDPEEWDNFDIKKALAEQEELRRKCLVIYKNDVLKRDNHACVDCGRGQGEVSIQIHHTDPYEFADIYRKNGYEGTLKWHSDPKNWKYLVTLCVPCHKKRHKADSDEVA